MPLELEFVKLIIVKGTEFPRQPAEGANKSKLTGNNSGRDSEPKLLRKGQASLGFALHFNERIARREEVHDQGRAAIPGISEVAALVRSLESAPQQIAASPHMFRPWDDVNSKGCLSL